VGAIRLVSPWPVRKSTGIIEPRAECLNAGSSFLNATVAEKLMTAEVLTLPSFQVAVKEVFE
jgi:hypothetical protein